jgi:hypothetical protein
MLVIVGACLGWDGRKKNIASWDMVLGHTCALRIGTSHTSVWVTDAVHKVFCGVSRTYLVWRMGILEGGVQ